MNVAVGELRLRASRREVVPPVVADFTDALRTASLPVRAGEILVVRRLDLGRIPAGFPRQALARRIEASLAACRIARWRPGALLPADAPAVAFPGLVEAALAVLVDRRPDPVREAALATVFGPAVRRPARETFPAVLARVLALGPAPAGRLLIEIERAGRLAPLLAALAEPQAETLRRSIPTRLAFTPPAAPRTVPALAAPVAPGRAAAAAETFAKPLGRILPSAPEPARRILARALAAGEHARHRDALAVELVLHAVAGPAAVSSVLEAVARALTPPSAPIAFTRKAAPVSADACRETPAAPVAPDAPRSRPRRRPVEPEVPPPAARPIPAEATEAPDEAPEPRSACAGLLLFLRLFRLLDLDRAEEALSLPLQAMLLAGFARRLGLRPDDPLTRALPAVPEGLDASAATTTGWAPAPPVLAVLPSAAWTDQLLTAARGRLALGGRPGAAPALAAIRRGQALAVQVLAHRLTGLGWRGIARRPAAVTCTRSHLDLTFEADAIDLRLRRAGLDLDPGWVPFLGRVVGFHYDDTGLVHHLPRWSR